MCKFFVLYDPKLFDTWANLAMVGYKKYCKRGILSAGLVEVKEGAVVRQRSIPPQECFPDQHPTLTYPNSTVFYHIRIPFDRTPESVVLDNVHPFLLEGGRFVAMHNGLIHFKRSIQLPPSMSDSRQFFHLWMTHYKQLQDLELAFSVTKKLTTPSSSMNIILYDTVEKKLYLHRSSVEHKLVPPMWISPKGVTNFRVPGGKTIPKGRLMVVDL